MWKDINTHWREAITLAWEAYKKGTIPIGCVIVNNNDEVIARGKNRIFDLDSKHPLAGSNMAHAEMTALLGLKEKEHPKIRKYSLYTTMEPCPMCFGTMIMMNIRNVFYGARDNFGGATSLNDKLSYIKAKNISIRRGEKELEVFQLILQSAYEYKRNHPRKEVILNKFSESDKEAVKYAELLNEMNYFNLMAKEDKVETIYDNVLIGYYEFTKR